MFNTVLRVLPKIWVDCIILMTPWFGLVDSFTIDTKPPPWRKTHTSFNFITLTTCSSYHFGAGVLILEKS